MRCSHGLQGKLNLLGTFNSVYTKELPANYPQCSIVLRIVFKRVEEGEHKLRINFVDEDGKFVMPSIELPFEVNVPPGDSFLYRNFILNIQRLKFENFGQHAIDIAIDGRQEASIPLEVKQVPDKENTADGEEDASSHPTPIQSNPRLAKRLGR